MDTHGNNMNTHKENIEGEQRKLSIVTHRGLDPEKKGYYAESSREAFADQIARGFGLEFDLLETSDGRIVVAHDPHSLKSLEKNAVSFRELLEMIGKNKENRSINAIHIKSKLQQKETMKKFCEEMRDASTNQFVLFDLTVESARYLKTLNSALGLAPSVAHPYDIERYNTAVGGTLLPIEKAIENKDIFTWVWLDEWDRTDQNAGTKSLYNKETFDRLREAGFKIALVTPELHATSPNLLGGEAHQDAATQNALEERFDEIVALQPDAICTDYPEKIKDLIKKYDR